MKKLLAVLVIGVVLAIIMMLHVWQRHYFVSGLNPFLSLVFSFLFLITAVLLMYLGIRWVRKRWVGDARYMPAVLFAAGGLGWCIGSLFWEASTLELQLKDTYFIVSGYMAEKWVLIFLFGVSGIYLLLSKVFADRWLNAMGYVHFWGTFIGCYLALWPKEIERLAGMPRRYIDYGDGFNIYKAGMYMTNKALLVVLILQVIFVCMIAYAGGKRLQVSRNP